MKVEVKQGSAEELIAYLEQHRDKQNLVLLIVDTEAADTGNEAQPDSGGRIIRSLADIEYEDGVPVLPKRGLKQPITMELVKQLLEEDDDFSA
jgi:hypothetical protein